MTELTQEQFEFLKGLCENRMLILVCPVLLPDDKPEMHELYEKNIQEIRTMIGLGFLEEITEKFNEANDEAKQRGTRPCTAYQLTSLTLQMFGGPEGSVN